MQHSLETTASQQGRVNHLRSISGRHDDDAVQGLHTVHAGQQLVHHAVADIAAFRSASTAPHGGDGFEFIQEDNRRGGLLGLLENLSDGPLGFADPL